MPFGLPLLLQQGWSEASTSLSKWHCAGCGMAQLSEQPSHHKQPQSLVLLTQPLQTPDVAAKSPEISSKLTFSANGYILVPQSALVGLSDRSAGASTDVCIKQVNSTCGSQYSSWPNSRTRRFLKLDKAYASQHAMPFHEALINREE